jgi:hypothetical protein
VGDSEQGTDTEPERADVPAVAPASTHLEYLYTIGEGPCAESYGYGIALAKVGT